jgi:hypothetical protein
MFGLSRTLVLGSLERVVNSLSLLHEAFRDSGDRETLAVAADFSGSVQFDLSVVVMALLLATALADEKSIFFQDLLLLLVVIHSFANASADEGSLSVVVVTTSLLVGIQINAFASALESDIIIRRRGR